LPQFLHALTKNAQLHLGATDTFEYYGHHAPDVGEQLSVDSYYRPLLDYAEKLSLIEPFLSNLTKLAKCRRE